MRRPLVAWPTEEYRRRRNLIAVGVGLWLLVLGCFVGLLCLSGRP